MRQWLWLGCAAMLLGAPGAHARGSEGSRTNSLLLNGAWEWAFGEGTEAVESLAAGTGLPWQKVTLPGAFAAWNQDVANHTKCVWARRIFTVTAAQSESLAVLRWNRIANGATAFLNGRKVGCWFRLGGGSLVRGLSLRQFGKGQFLEGVEYTGGVADPAVWNQFEAEGRLRQDVESLDIHIHCRIPADDPDLLRKSSFYLDDLFLQAIEEPGLAVTTPLDEYYVGEAIPWIGRGSAASNAVRVALMNGGKLLAEQTRDAVTAPPQGAFDTRGLKPGLYTLQAKVGNGGLAPSAVERQIIVTPDPFGWGDRSR